MNSIFIFRRDFRINDNTGLYHCIKESDNVYPIFIFTPEQIKDNKFKSNNAVQFMIESLKYQKECYNKYFKIVKDNYTYIEYNETINLDSIIKKIKSIFPELILKDNSNECLAIQDKSKNYNDKITNYDEVKYFIEEELKTFNI